MGCTSEHAGKMLRHLESIGVAGYHYGVREPGRVVQRIRRWRLTDRLAALWNRVME
jgi:hypothetical protein